MSLLGKIARGNWVLGHTICILVLRINIGGVSKIVTLCLSICRMSSTSRNCD